jgi:hypothetical protein
MVEIPSFDSLAQGERYADVPAPETDAVSTDGWGNSRIPNLPQGQPSPVEAMSIATMKDDAPNLAQTWSSGDKKGPDGKPGNWMGNDSYPTSKTGTEPVA